MSKEQSDVEMGNACGGKEAAPAALLYPKMPDARLRWAFIRKVYSILSAQFLFTAGVATVATVVRPIPAFLLSHTPAAWAVFVLILISPFIAMLPMLIFRERHPINMVFLAIYTFCISCSVGLACATFKGLFLSGKYFFGRRPHMGKIILEATILTGTVTVALTLFTFWAARRGKDFSFLHPFLFASLIILLVYLSIQLFFPLGKVAYTIYSMFATVVFSGLIIHDTDRLIKRHGYDEYIVAAISLYLDIVNLFMTLLGFSGISQ